MDGMAPRGAHPTPRLACRLRSPRGGHVLPSRPGLGREGRGDVWRAPQPPSPPSHHPHTILQVEAIISVRNEGKLAANVSSIMGSLNDAAAFHLHYQNFSFVPAQGVPELAPGVEVSVPYFFTPAPSLPEHAFQVALTVFMVGEGGVRAASTPFNRTIDIVAPVRWIDFEMLGLWAALAGLVAGLGWVGYHSFGAGAPTVNADGSVRKARPAASRPRSSSTAAPADPAAWLKGTNFAGKSK